MNRTPLHQFDPDLAAAIDHERDRQNDGLELIPSENFVSPAVLEALGSVMTNKYSEGYPRKRYYGGNQFIDDAEELAIARAKQLFGAEHVNVQPYSGSPANIEVYFALLEFGDTVMGMSLDQGGHLTHGHKVNFSGRAYQFVQYGVDESSHRLDYEKIRALARKTKPKLILSGATAYPRIIDFKAFAEIAEEVGAISMADISHIAGLIVGGVHQSPFPYTDVVTTTTHKTLRGPRGAMIMCKEQFAKAIDKAVFPGMQGGPHDHVTAAKAVAFKEALRPQFKAYAAQIVKNAQALAASLVAEGLDVVTGGTDNHLILVDLSSIGVTGKEAEVALDKANITCNKNMVPYDKRSPFDPSGIRLGTPAITTRGMVEEDMRDVGRYIATVVKHHTDEAIIKDVKRQVIALARRYPLY
ncbi:serine hydroxymethyltransferase [Candidatus Woesearchaeota archaeon CG_4_10_14_0_2_um_filter_57_5]|nr:MAG: serine hydroxymethyltransferase [Candidatus Woesearchaeota archaeon CG1_02_57_44]PIZ57211.1 MAG: serine hydroxymethyltransferase [Candidatus Woesearchaeota archaeon CG_4_10_14_0_2_um_filter_57_5]